MSDLFLPPEILKANPAESYDDLKRQFFALKRLCESKMKQCAIYSSKLADYDREALIASNENLSSERDMNAQLTSELMSAEAKIKQLERERDELKRHSEEVADVIGFPRNNNNRLNTPVITTNIRNIKHFCSHLDALERGIFMVDGEPDEEGEFGLECIFNRWAWSSEKYSSEFGKWLAQHNTEQQIKTLEWVLSCRELNLSQGGIHTLMDKCNQLRKGVGDE